jgi:dipeptidyl aminopeptidase/acylaminoacyl peptidase
MTTSLSSNVPHTVAQSRISKHFLGWIAIACLVMAVCELLAVGPTTMTAQTGPRRFTVADDIGITMVSSEIMFSPDDRFFIVQSDRGRLDLNRAESSLRVYSTEEINRLLSQPNSKEEPPPLWAITKSTYKDGPIIDNVRWLDDSSGFMFLAKTESGNDQLFLANPHTKNLKALTGEDQSVKAFVVRSEKDFVYAVSSKNLLQRANEWRRSAAVVGTGQSLASLMFPENEDFSDVCELWAVFDGKRLRVIDSSSQHPVSIHSDGFDALALSPDGHSLVTVVTVPTVPPEWETLYPPPPPIALFPRRVRAGRQDPDALDGEMDIDEYVLIDLINGRITPLTNAPGGEHAGWFGRTTADWSADGKFVVMSDTFLPADKQPALATANRPCVAVADLSTGEPSCVERLRERTEEDWQEKWEADAHFVSGKSDRIIARYTSGSSRVYVRSADRSWNAEGPVRGSVPESHAVDVQIKQDLNQPPVLIATDKQGKTSRILWDPNPQLKDIQLGDVSVFKWKDKAGRDWAGGLYKPPDYLPGKRYPLVIQTHGFFEHTFFPSGLFTTAFAAQELAAVGVMVLQVQDCDIRSIERASCHVAGYEAAVQQLASEGLVDPDRVGIIGFSMTGYYVLEALTTGTLHFKAASITDSNTYSYVQYMTWDMLEDALARQAEAAIGARPFGSGLQQWLKRSWGFNVDKVETPLQVVAVGLGGPKVLTMWEPYRALSLLKKPVDLIVLTDGEHVLTNPAARMASQGGSVDWFRFWLKGEEDPDPAKADQYARWHELRKLQENSEKAANK